MEHDGEYYEKNKNMTWSFFVQQKFTEHCKSIIMKKEKSHQGVPFMAQWLTNPNRNHEVAGLIPGLAQWVKDLALP